MFYQCLTRHNPRQCFATDDDLAVKRTLALVALMGNDLLIEITFTRPLSIAHCHNLSSFQTESIRQKLIPLKVANLWRTVKPLLHSGKQFVSSKICGGNPRGCPTRGRHGGLPLHDAILKAKVESLTSILIADGEILKD